MSHILASPDGRYSIYDGMNPACGTGVLAIFLQAVLQAFCLQVFHPDASRLGVLVHGKA